MKRITFSGLAFLFVVAIFLSSCAGLSTMKKAEGTVKYTVTPNPLELQGNEVQVSVEVKYPAKFFNKKAVMEITPYLKYDGGEFPLDKVTVQGESVEANNQVIKNAEGGSVKYNTKFTYKDEMMKSDLMVKADAWITKKEAKKVSLDPVKIGDGIIVTQKLVKIDPRPLMVGDNYVKSTSDSYQADIMYVINRAEVRASEIKKPDVQKFNDYVKNADNPNSREQLKGLEVSAYASPDGGVKLNTKLSANREVTASEYLKKALKKAKISAADKADLWKVMSTPQDWDGFKTLMEKSNIKDKDLVLRVLSMYSDPTVREKEIRNMSKTFEEIAKEILPQLRRSKLIATVEKAGFNDQEILSFFETNPDTLSLEQLLYGASLTQDLNKKLAFYQKASDKFPGCWRAKNDVGYVYILMGKPAEAKVALTAAKALKDDNVIKNNLGVVALLEGDTKTAEELFTSALGAGDLVSYNLGIINIMNGKYDAAVKYFGSTNEYNTALAKLLNKQPDAALGTLNNLKDEDAQTYYLKAVANARSEKPEAMYANLRLAVGKDAKWKAYAKKDLEFFKYFNEDTFKSIVQ